jgi:hypothetical protein
MAIEAGDVFFGVRKAAVEEQLPTKLDLGAGEGVVGRDFNQIGGFAESHRQDEVERLVIGRVVQPRSYLVERDRSAARDPSEQAIGPKHKPAIFVFVRQALE